SGEVVTVDGVDPASAITWTERRLLLATRTQIRIIDNVATASARPVFSVALNLSADPAAVATFTGLTYVTNGPCVDVFVGAALVPRLRAAACVSRPISAEHVLVITRETLTVLD